MKMDRSESRRKFLQKLGSASVLLTARPFHTLASKEQMEERIIRYEKKISSNDTVRIACIGMGIMGHNNLNSALKVPGVELVAVSDLYQGRLDRAREIFGTQLFTTRDYREILNRKDIDAIIVSTSDNWHARITTDALKAGKAVYCEKPFVHRIAEGLPLIQAQKSGKNIVQVGSQGVSSIANLKAKELFRAGEIGQITCIEASFDRQSSLGAWEYTMPTDNSPETVDWDRYIAGTPKKPYDPKKFFWWRNYKDYGTGVAGDLFVHLLSKIHLITDSKGPEKIFSTGQLAYWKDGRDVPDVMTAIMDYPETKEHAAFQTMLRVNFISGGGDGGHTRIYGTEGVLEFNYDGFSVNHSLMPAAPGIGGWDALFTYPKQMQEELMSKYEQQYPKSQRSAPKKEPIKYKVPEGFDEHVEHFVNFFDAIRDNKPVVEDAVFGFRAAAPCLACNDSYFQKKVIRWNPETMKIV